MLLAAVEFKRDGAAFGDAQAGLEAFGQALLHVGACLEPVDDDVDVVLFVLLELGQRFGLDHLAGLAVAADAKTHIATRLHVLEEVDELALAVAHHRRQDHQARVFGQRQHGVDHLAHALRLQRQAVVGAIGRAGAGIEQAQVVVDLGDRAHRAAWVVAGGLLLDADGRAQAFDDVDIGLVHQLQELARVGAQALDIAALAFGVQRVERQAALARTRQAGDHHQRMLGDVEIDVLEVVRARAAHFESARFLIGHARWARVLGCVGIAAFGHRGPGQTGHDNDHAFAAAVGCKRRRPCRTCGERRKCGANRPLLWDGLVARRCFNGPACPVRPRGPASTCQPLQLCQLRRAYGDPGPLPSHLASTARRRYPQCRAAAGPRYRSLNS